MWTTTTISRSRKNQRKKNPGISRFPGLGDVASAAADILWPNWLFLRGAVDNGKAYGGIPLRTNCHGIVMVKYGI